MTIESNYLKTKVHIFFNFIFLLTDFHCSILQKYTFAMNVKFTKSKLCSFRTVSVKSTELDRQLLWPESPGVSKLISARGITR